MRISCYLNAVDVGEGRSLLYNGLTSRVDLVPSDVARRLIGDTDRRDFSFLSSEEAQYLVNRGHLTGLTVRNEREEFRKLAEHVLNADQELHALKDSARAVTFILTYKCNLSCSYCFQSGLRKGDANLRSRRRPHPFRADLPPVRADLHPVRAEVSKHERANPERYLQLQDKLILNARPDESLPAMDRAFVDRFFDIYFEKLFPGCDKNSVGFQLFGGEPLLPGNRGAIERILHYAKKHGTMVSAATNATMLSRMLDLTGPESGKIQRIQVTLDGSRAFHDSIRVGPSGAPTFDSIIRSLHELIERKVDTVIRVHLHPNRIDTARELAEYLEREGILGHGRVSVYFEPINSFDGEDAPLSSLQGFPDLFKNVALLQKGPPSVFARSFAGILNPAAMKNRLRTRYCAAGTNLFRIVDSLGDIYECYEDAGNKTRRIAKLADGEVKYFRLADTYAKRHILNQPECLKCSIGLFCGGGCMSRARLERGSVFKSFCGQNRDLVGQTIKAHFLLQEAGKSTP